MTIVTCRDNANSSAIWFAIIEQISQWSHIKKLPSEYMYVNDYNNMVKAPMDDSR